MNIKVKTSVNAEGSFIIRHFNRDLFEKLNPPFPKVKLIRFDGSKKGDVVALELNFIFFKQRWESLITDDGEDESSHYFIDIGVKLPFFLSEWTHRHIIKKTDNGSLIVDDINFRSYNLIFTFLMAPLIYFQMVFRKPIYRSYFNRLGSGQASA